MAEVDVKLVLDVEVTLKLNEREAMALDALAGYGTDAFLKCFYKHMGESYLKPHERGLVSLFHKIRGMNADLPIDQVRKAIAFYEKNKPETNGERWAREREESAKPREGVVVNGGAHG